MTAFEKFLDPILASLGTEGLMVFFLGGFAVCVICTVLIVTPWFRGIPLRPLVAIGSVFPVAVLIYGGMCDLFVRGRHLSIMLALSPVLLIFLPTVWSSVRTLADSPMPRRLRFISLLAIILAAQLWATLVIWLATNYGFMGASC